MITRHFTRRIVPKTFGKLIQRRNIAISDHIWVSPQLGRILKWSGFLVGGWCGMQWLVGTESKDTVIRHEFNSEKSPYTLVDYYGTEDFLEELALLPQFYHLIMDGSVLDERGKAEALGGALQVEDVFRTREMDTTGDGEDDAVEWFNKKMIMEGFALRFLGRQMGLQFWILPQS